MATLSGSVGLFLACALLSMLLSRVEGDAWGDPCEERQRSRQNQSESDAGWGLTLSILGTLSTLMMLGQYVTKFLTKDQCPEEWGKCEMQQEDCQESCKKADKGRTGACGSREFACLPDSGEPCTSLYSQTQEAYAQQLACMEQQLKELLYKVQSQRSTLQETPTAEECFPNTMAKGSDKLHITVYEIADLEGINDEQPRVRKRKFK
uniref:Uncharacterized protein n=1 Tax=Sphaerodactylus townsendi TaxID=933632 RepID=A0ACB8G8I7_9SAUR